MSSFFISPTTARNFPIKQEISEPFGVDGLGEIGLTVDPAAWAKNHILALLLTSAGERVMRPTYGVGLKRFLFENNDQVVVQHMVSNIKTSLQAWEPGIILTDVSVVSIDQQSGLVEIRIAYQLNKQAVTFTVSVNVNQ